MNKIMALAAVLILCAPVIAKENPADYPLKAHVVSVVSPKDGPIPGPPLRCAPPRLGETMIQIGNVLYTAECRHKEIQVGQDYPAQLYEKSISLLFNERSFPIGCAKSKRSLNSKCIARAPRSRPSRSPRGNAGRMVQQMASSTNRGYVSQLLINVSALSDARCD